MHSMKARYAALALQLFTLSLGRAAEPPIVQTDPPAGIIANSLEAALDPVAPNLKKWAALCIVKKDAQGHPVFQWHDYKQTSAGTDFWPASTIKLYAVIAALELLHENGFSLDTIVRFEHREENSEAWTEDCERPIAEMISEVFKRSSNEDYTLLLRLTGIDRINSQFLTPERGFPHSALMRGYVLGRPYGYVLKEPQRITLHNNESSRSFEHTWSGRFYAQERGCTIISEKTGNLTSPRELAECLRRVLFHEALSETDRYRLDMDQIRFIRSGSANLVGLETKNPDSGPSAWTFAAEELFPSARFFHK